jgi:hypothetical protein
MRDHIRLFLCSLAAGCAPGVKPEGDSLSPFLFVWAYDQDHRPGETNFIAVVDIDPESGTVGQVVSTAPGAEGGAHHTEFSMPPGGLPLFANGYMDSRTWLVDLNNPAEPKVVGETDRVPGFNHPHSFFRLKDGSVLATLQHGDGTVRGNPGGVARYSAEGKVLAFASAADSSLPGADIQPYGMTGSEATDRIVTTSSPMADARTADVVQIHRLSDLALLKTIAMPISETDSAWHYPFEIRMLPDGRSAFLNTWYCAFYLLSGVDKAEPELERVYLLERGLYKGCSVPVLFDRYWIMPVSLLREIVVLDITDPRHPREVHSLTVDSTFEPHWAARDPLSDRIVIPSQADGDPRILIARFDSTTGRLRWDERFRDPTTGQLGVSMKREAWAHGATGPATPHGIVFGSGNGVAGRKLP